MTQPHIHTCRNCGNTFEGSYCNHCGQKWLPERFTTGSLWRNFVAARKKDVLSFFHTSWTLLIRPGTVFQAYLSGQRKAYYQPLNYFLLVVSLAAFVALLNSETGTEASVQKTMEIYEQFGLPVGENSLKGGIAGLEFAKTHFNLILMLTLPFWAFASFILFRKRGYTLGEHLIFWVYIYGIYQVLVIPTMPFGNLGDFTDRMTILHAIVMILYLTWVHRDWYKLAWWKSFGTSVLTYLLYFVLFFVSVIGISLAVVILLIGGAFILKQLGLWG
ncbi:MAG: DUF3667 domain-containing protein [Bacteroidota bacterium]